MASDVGICNVALSFLGDTASVSSISPPDGSVQAEHCARFYPIARDALLEMHGWSFATTRLPLALLSETMNQWIYVYAMPANVVNVIAVIPPDARDDYSSRMSYDSRYGYTPEFLTSMGDYVPQPYSIETLADGSQVICTSQQNAVLRFTFSVTDPAQFSPLFTLAFSWLLASMLAGPIIKGTEGAAEGKRCLQAFQAFLTEATASDAVQRNTKPRQVVSWLAGR